MPRLTAAEVVALGDYLEPEFDPSSLTISQLLGVMGHHGIPFPLPYSKPILVQLFVDKVVSQADRLKEQRLKVQCAKPSDKDIIDGLAEVRPRRLRRKVRLLDQAHSSYPWQVATDAPLVCLEDPS